MSGRAAVGGGRLEPAVAQVDAKRHQAKRRNQAKATKQRDCFRLRCRD